MTSDQKSASVLERVVSCANKEICKEKNSRNAKIDLSLFAMANCFITVGFNDN